MSLDKNGQLLNKRVINQLCKQHKEGNTIKMIAPGTCQKIPIIKMHMLLLLCILSTRFAAPLAQGTPSPLSEIEQVTMMVLHNLKRGAVTNQINMECLEQTNGQMGTYAQNLANTCNLTAPTDSQYGLGFFEIASVGIPALEDYVNRAEELHNLFYDYLKNEATGIEAREDSLFRQVYWYEAQELGCGRAICNGKTVVVCAYTHKQNQKSFPYIQMQGAQTCAACRSAKSACIGGLCCKNVTGPGTTPTPTPSGSCGSTPGNLTQLIRIWYGTTSTNYLLTDQMEVYRIMMQPRAEYNGPIGRVAQAPDTGCPQLVPIHHLYRAITTTDYYVVDSSLYQALLMDGYEDRGIIGYAVKGENVCGATIPVYEFYQTSTGHMQLQAGQDATKVFNLQYGVWDWRGVSFWIWSPF